MKKTYKLSDSAFDRLLNEAVEKSIKKVLKEDWFDDMDTAFDTDTYNDEDDDSYTADLLRKTEKEIGSSKDILGKGNDEKIIAQTSAEEGDEEEDDDSIESISSIEEPDSDDYLYKDAYDAIESSDGSVTFEEWFSGLEDTDKAIAQTAFDKANKDFSERDSYETDEVPMFSGRHEDVEPEHKAGNVIEYDGVEINDDGNQYTMVANVRNPLITIKGKSLNDVKNTYNSLWSDLGSMEDKARKMGMTLWHGALLWSEDYDKWVRAAGAHEENLPIVIDLDKLATKNMKNKLSQPQKGSDSGMSWLEPFKHGNGKYMMTDYQASKLNPEQRSKWEQLKKMNPAQYTSYAEAPSEKKANRYKK